MSRIIFEGYPKLFSLSMIKTHLGILDKGFLGEFMYRTMLRLANYFWVLACKCFFHLVGFTFRYICRLNSADHFQKEDSDFKADHLLQDDQITSITETEKESHEFVFGFRFQNCETEHSVFKENFLNQNTSKREFISTEDFRGFIEEPETVTFSVQESYVVPNDAPIEDIGYQDYGECISKSKDSVIHKKTEGSDFEENSPNQTTSKYQFISTKDVSGFIEDPESMKVSIQELCVSPNDAPIVDNRNQESEKFNTKTEESVENPGKDNVVGIPEEEISSDSDFPGKKEIARLEINHLGPNNFSHEVGLSSQNPFWRFDLELRTSISTEEVDSVTDDFSADTFQDEESDNSSQEFAEKNPNLEEISYGGTRISDTDDEFIELEPYLQYLDKTDHENLERKEEEGISEEAMSKEKSWDSDIENNNDDDGEDDEFDILLKHQESVKVGMKNSRNRGMLPTISEECETPKMVEDLKPLRIDEKFGHKDRLGEIQKVYKGYAEKMRKLDVLNYQTLHAISFLQLKDQIHQGPTQKSSVSTIKSLVFPNLWQIKQRRIYADPILKSITDLHRNLELVYVGQTCLSWEILHWQYEKALELLEDDYEGYYFSYNQVAAEFQQFQVLAHRFVENEPFQGPRVQTYAKNRCDIRSLLQVPVIKEDCFKDKKDGGVEEDYEVSAAMLAQLIDESMHVFWEFLHADKDEANVILKGIQSTIVDLQDPSDFELFMDIKTSLQKKDKRLKDILRSGNCIVKKFQKHQQIKLEGKLLIAQVELKLISRVLNMSRLTTDQLVWCQKKLNKISFVNRKLHVEPSFLFFPL